MEIRADEIEAGMKIKIEKDDVTAATGIVTKVSGDMMNMIVEFSDGTEYKFYPVLVKHYSVFTIEDETELPAVAVETPSYDVPMTIEITTNGNTNEYTLDPKTGNYRVYAYGEWIHSATPETVERLMEAESKKAESKAEGKEESGEDGDDDSQPSIKVGDIVRVKRHKTYQNLVGGASVTPMIEHTHEGYSIARVVSISSLLPGEYEVEVEVQGGYDYVPVEYVEKIGLDDVMTAAEAQTEYNLSESAVRQACGRGSILARKSGDTWLILRKDAEARWGHRKFSEYKGTTVTFKDTGGTADLVTLLQDIDSRGLDLPQDWDLDPRDVDWLSDDNGEIGWRKVNRLM